MLEILDAFEASTLIETDCYFVGGAAIAMALGQYRETLDIFPYRTVSRKDLFPGIRMTHFRKKSGLLFASMRALSRLK